MQNTTSIDWRVTHLDGSAAPQLADLQGKPTLLLFFSLGCLGCLSRGVPLAQQFAINYPELNVIGVHSNFGNNPYSAGQVQALVDERELQFPVLMDEGHVTYDSFEAEGTPHWVLLDEQGQVEKSFFGSQPNSVQRLTYAMLERFGD